MNCVHNICNCEDHSLIPKSFAHCGGCYFASATEKVEDAEFSFILFWSIEETVNFIVMFSAGELQDIHVPYGPLELRDSCMQINNITSIKEFRRRFPFVRTGRLDPLPQKSVSQWNRLFFCTLGTFWVGACPWDLLPIPELVQLNFFLPYTRLNPPNSPNRRIAFRLSCVNLTLLIWLFRILNVVHGFPSLD